MVPTVSLLETPLQWSQCGTNKLCCCLNIRISIFLNSSPIMMVHYAETDMNANLFLNLSLGILLIDYAVV